MHCNHYTWKTVPSHHKTRKQWLKLHRRLKRGAKPCGTITYIFDKPRKRPKYVEAVPPDGCDRRVDHLLCTSVHYHVITSWGSRQSLRRTAVQWPARRSQPTG